MSDEYSVEEVREFARSVATYGNAKHTAMLIDLIERIKADERAVPVYFCYDNGHWDLATKAWYDSWPTEKNKKTILSPASTGGAGG